jgi:hypothetical protein
MSNLAKHYGSAEGPLGFPMQDRQAFALETILKALPREDCYRYRKAVMARGASETLAGERSDVSWISTEDPDREGEVVIARGMNDSQFKLNPIVTMQHAYFLPPVGKSLWRKVVKDGELRGVKAKTQYPARPINWEGPWPADVAFSLVQADLLRGKSIGFLPTKVHVPEAKEIDKHGWKDVALVIDEWLLLEYAVTFLPAQQNALVEAVGKSSVALPDEFIQAMGLSADLFQQSGPTVGARNYESALGAGAALGTGLPSPPSPLIPFTPLAEIERAFERHLAAWDLRRLTRQAVQEHIDRIRGRI